MPSVCVVIVVVVIAIDACDMPSHSDGPLVSLLIECTCTNKSCHIIKSMLPYSVVVAAVIVITMPTTMQSVFALYNEQVMSS